MLSIQVENERHSLEYYAKWCHLQAMELCTVIILVTNQTLIRHRLISLPSIRSNNNAVSYDGKMDELLFFYLTCLNQRLRLF